MFRDDKENKTGDNRLTYFSKAARLVDESGAVVILKNNVPRYLVMEFSAAEQEQVAADEDVMAVSKRLIEKNRQAYEVPAK
ncbi:MAG TPA: type II toxin-antitoxin system Phd/YefM family antitoxin [Candidatus Scatomonas pullistercoris]|uniref:Type II toxin-antitoxin system Phd/YefM family antitoxin n=1 Tax=Candidatus Scatomonas pullistercoris TaxID=2840920 RepID=A0A9D1TBG0_9FIRM|nr:type II toxin-antitoxin system Phd/YefM family antitoxin [Candidatus Scatomonas pullistercoris]